MEKTLQLAGMGMNSNFVDDSPQSVKSQASSTFMFSRTELDLKDVDDENAFQSPKTISGTMALSTTSSLGVIDLEKQSLLSEKDDSISQRLQESIRESKCFLDEQRSMSFNRFKRRLDDFSISNNSSSDDLPIENQDPFNFFEKAVPSNNPKILSQLNSSVTLKPVPSSPSTKVSLFSDISNGPSPVFDSSFECGKSAVMKLEADQKENRKEFGSLPVTPTNISLTSENSDERERQFTEFIRAKCYSPEEISNVLRNKLNFDTKESAPIMVNTVSNSLSQLTSEENFEHIVSSNSQLPSQIPKVVPHALLKSGSNFSESGRLSGVEEKLNSVTSNWPAHENFVLDPKNGSISSTICSEFWEESRASSIASINQIAEALRRKSLMAEPKLAIEHLLSIGKSKPKLASTVSPCESSTKSIPSVVKTVAPQQRPQYEFTPTTSRNVNTPSTITCSTNDLCVDSVTGKVRTRNVPFVSEFTTARKLLESRMDDKDSNASHMSLPLTNDSNDVKHFSLSKTISLLDLSDDGGSPQDEFWKLNVPAEVYESGDLLLNHLNAVRDKMRHLPNDLMSVLKCGSTTTNTATEPVRQISFSHNITSAEDFCDTFDGDIASDVIHAGTLCLGTQVEVIIDIENPCREPLKYKMALKSILLNGEINLRAVSVMLVSNYPDVILLPKSDNEIKIMLSPLMQGKLDVVLEFISEEKKYSNITRQIRITGENPKLKLEFPEKPEISFELLAESSVKNVPLLLKNKGVARLPLRFLIFEGAKRTFFARTVIEPSETFECDVRVTTFELSESQAPIINLTGVLMILLDTFEESSLGKSMILQTLPLSAKVGKTSVVVNDSAPLTLCCSPLLKSSSHLINVTNTGMVPLDVTVQTVESGQSEFLIEPHVFQLLPRNTKSLKTVFKPSTKERKREIDLHLIFNGTSKKYSTKIVGIVENDVVSSSMGTPLRHSPTTCITPHSSSSDSSTGADGPMELDCTHNSISWGSVPLHTKNIQTITLRNRSSQKEKLLLSISDTNGAFRFVENKSSLRDLKLTLEPRESRKISVIFMPFVADQAMNGRIVIIRRHSLEASVGELQKRVIPLYGIGGTAKISFSGVFRDNENRLWITPETESLETKFSIENMGDSVAFVKIVSEDADDAVVPDEMVLLPAESAEVNYAVHLNKDRVDSLHKQNPSKEVLLANKLTVFSGCESTRLRLQRLWTRYRDFENIQRIRNKLELLMDMNSPSKVMVESLSDSQFVLSNLWYEGVAEQVIGVLLPEQQLESACLDSTIVFKDLADVTSIP